MRSKYRVLQVGNVYYPQERFLYFFWINILTCGTQFCPTYTWARVIIEGQIKRKERKIFKIK